MTEFHHSSLWEFFPVEVVLLTSKVISNLTDAADAGAGLVILQSAKHRLNSVRGQNVIKPDIGVLSSGKSDDSDAADDGGSFMGEWAG